MLTSACTLRSPSFDNCGSKEVMSAMIERSGGSERFILRHSSTQGVDDLFLELLFTQWVSFDRVLIGVAGMQCPLILKI